jgi:hypothetical protein
MKIKVSWRVRIIGALSKCISDDGITADFAVLVVLIFVSRLVYDWIFREAINWAFNIHLTFSLKALCFVKFDLLFWERNVSWITLIEWYYVPWGILIKEYVLSSRSIFPLHKHPD